MARPDMCINSFLESNLTLPLSMSRHSTQQSEVLGSSNRNEASVTIRNKSCLDLRLEISFMKSSASSKRKSEITVIIAGLLKQPRIFFVIFSGFNAEPEND